MLTMSQINEAVSKLIAAVHPKKVILFGSYARGEATEHSDLDLMVIDPDMDLNRAEIEGRRAIGWMGVGVDILAYDRQTVEERADWCSSPIHWALEEGKVLYNAEA